MATLPTQSFATTLANFAAGVQGRAAALIDFAIGSTVRAIGEATSSVALWLQAMVLQVVLLTRLATSYGADVDTFLADTQIITRLGAQAATGLVTFARFTATSASRFIPNGTLVQTGDNTQQFTVYGDTTNTAYSATLLGYTMPSNVATVIVPVVSITPSPNSILTGLPGANGNVQAGAITLIASPLTGVDTVINVAAFTNGFDQESDAAVKVRFPLAVAALSKATDIAIKAAVASVQVGMQSVIHENVDPNGATDISMVTVYIDDGSGAPSVTLVAACAAAVNAIRAAGVRTGVYAATTLLANVSMTLTTAASFDHSVVIAQVTAALGAFINATGLENTLAYTQLAAIAYGVAGVTNVSSVLLNSGTSDLVPTFGQTIKAGILTLS